jgi:hypothetical protein
MPWPRRKCAWSFFRNAYRSPQTSHSKTHTTLTTEGENYIQNKNEFSRMLDLHKKKSAIASNFPSRALYYTWPLVRPHGSMRHHFQRASCLMRLVRAQLHSRHLCKTSANDDLYEGTLVRGGSSRNLDTATICTQG